MTYSQRNTPMQSRTNRALRASLMTLALGALTASAACGTKAEVATPAIPEQIIGPELAVVVASILLAQVAATIGIGGTVWLRDQARHQIGRAHV